MNYEEFSPEAKAGIEQFRKCLKKNETFRYPTDLTVRWISNTQMVCIACMLNGADSVESLLAQKFAESKRYWFD